jgi:hypothetical protein
MACDQHAPAAKANCWDWHAVSTVCDVPGSMWNPGRYQGEGFCFWPEAEATMQESAVQAADTPTARHIPHMLDLDS